ncbi:ROK family protein [Pseudolysinimonas sp.]|jgi:predicted NBD/HSP70 family sugar kinase|uniref:ROK family protein n=1 Tax=Pseudolysinimonas sp. TaxID=2680009 RepID=UPI0037850D96
MSPRAAAASPANVSDVRRRNVSEALRSVIRAGRTTRATLAAECGVSVASATNLVGDLIAEGLIVEAGVASSRGGRPVTFLQPNPAGAYFVGADVGERGVAVELFDLQMNRVDREFRGGRTEEQIETIGDDLDAALEALQTRHPEAWTRLVGIGLALPGIVETDADGRQILYAQSLGWPPVDVADLVSQPLRIFAENGAKTQAMAELWDGAARGLSEALVVLLGRGVGLGIISDGELAHGLTSSAGEWGHLKIERGGRLCRCGGRGCVEAYLGADAILSAWREAGGRPDGSGWRAIGELLDADRAGDAVAVAVVDEIVATLGSALGGLVNLTNPERVVIGGWVGLRLMETLQHRIEAATRAEALRRPGGQFDLRPSAFGGDTVALGAALMPLEALIADPRASSPRS